LCGGNPTSIRQRVFMALRMAVNDELSNVVATLPQAVAALRPEVWGDRFPLWRDKPVEAFMHQEARGVCVHHGYPSASVIDSRSSAYTQTTDPKPR
jgi:16S rRNA C1402 N4-methylase RsmH